MGAFIRLKSQLKSRIEYFDVGVTGPLAGFVAALLLLFYGFTHLPSLDYLFAIHPSYAQYGADFAKYVYSGPLADQNLKLGDNLLFYWFKNYIANDPVLVPNGYELMHYPFLFAGYLSLFFTALNLMPIGQLDGGHILFSTFGPKVHAIVSPTIFVVFLFYAGLGTPQPIGFGYDPYLGERLFQNAMMFGLVYLSVSKVFPQTLNNFTLAVTIFGTQYLCKMLFPEVLGNSGWIIFALFLGRVLGIHHPPVDDNLPLTKGRLVISFLSLLVFILCFSPNPF